MLELAMQVVSLLRVLLELSMQVVFLVVLVIIFGLILIGYTQENGLQELQGKTF